ncbi:hypothetical protein [Lactiplantibacillus xiangfangensis]|uniref:Uncharacterized protein n=1 Tax=Lactiplantibacillus xiangfangensis TaxID=942150 RepID=A0A0R2MAT7_9LACO|nr:hypothetical protein [Lactiplantibacillus xiangfangensis]KRO07786.1 hypothetical protein IV64_GL001240 [Lactiplantibacillus xiangfangensis]
MSHLPVRLSANAPFIHLETCLHAIVQDGFSGLHTVKLDLINELTRLLDARITILLDQPHFILIIHNHDEKLAVLGTVQQHSNQAYDITLDGHTVNTGPTMIQAIRDFI